MKQCKCGGVVHQYELTNHREVLKCDSCGRRELIHTQVTEQLLKEGMSSKGGWKKAQLSLIGVEWPPVTGWKESAIGRRIEPKDAMRFLSLRE